MNHQEEDQPQMFVAEPETTYSTESSLHPTAPAVEDLIPSGYVSFDEFARIFEQKMTSRYAKL